MLCATEEVYDLIKRGFTVKQIVTITGYDVEYIKKIESLMKQK